MSIAARCVVCFLCADSAPTTVPFDGENGIAMLFERRYHLRLAGVNNAGGNEDSVWCKKCADGRGER